MDSKDVDAVLREVLWPALKAQGFSRRTGRTAWRDQGDAVGVVNVQSFNSYLADGLGATTFSFGVNLGVFFPAIADRSPIGAFVKDRSRPREVECQARLHLTKGFAQPPRPARSGLRPWGPKAPPDRWRDRPDVWLVLPDGSNVREAVADAAERVLADGLPWLDRLSDPREAVRLFHEAEDVFVPPGVMTESYGGSLGSPNRWRAIAALAAATADLDLLAWSIDEMSAHPYWLDRGDELARLRDEMERARSLTERT
jgi:hypothetical protein